VEAVEQQWRTLSGLTFTVHTADGRRFTLAYNEAADEWSIRPS